jgi:type III pantothenate kinase
MTPDVVVDVGNTRIKWGRCSGGRVATTASVLPDSPESWQEQIRAWSLPGNARWVLSGVHPARRDALANWLSSQGAQVNVLSKASCLPIQTTLATPERVGIDRLLDGVAAISRRQPEQPVVIVDAGSAVTVDWLDAAGNFCGGAIFPGMRLMAEALHNFTAMLPLIEIRAPEPPLPGANTLLAMEAGIFWTVVGGVRQIIDRLAPAGSVEPVMFVTGGDGDRLSPFLERPHKLWPEMTLEGVRLAAEQLP